MTSQVAHGGGSAKRTTNSFGIYTFDIFKVLLRPVRNKENRFLALLAINHASSILLLGCFSLSWTEVKVAAGMKMHGAYSRKILKKACGFSFQHNNP